MKNLQNFGVQELSVKEIKETEGGGWLGWVIEKMVDVLVDNYPNWVENGGSSQQTYGGIGIGLSGNTAFSGM
jgi:hypothetical protein